MILRRRVRFPSTSARHIVAGLTRLGYILDIDTRARMIEVAERLFAERGVNGVSLREIGVEAGQRNTGAARYHFGSKAGLVDAVFEHRMVPINERRTAMLEELDGEGRGFDIRGLAEAFLYPLSEMLGDAGRPSWYLRFCIHAAYVEGTAPTAIGRDPWTSGLQTVEQRFETALAEWDVPPGLRRERWLLFAGHVSHALAHREQMLHFGPRGGLTDRAVYLSDLVDTGVALATAAVSADTERLLRQRRPA